MPPAAVPPDHRRDALRQAIALAAGELARSGGWPARCARLGLAAPDEADGAVRVPVLGVPVVVRPSGGGAAAGEGSADEARQLLALHFLRCQGRAGAADEWITFRAFPGGAFYWEPFRRRVVDPLTRRFGNRLEALRGAAEAQQATVVMEEPGMLRAVAQGLGPLRLQLVYRAGDEEFGPTADLLFEGGFRTVLGAEDAAALGGLFTAALRPR